MLAWASALADVRLVSRHAIAANVIPAPLYGNGGERRARSGFYWRRNVRDVALAAPCVPYHLRAPRTAEFLAGASCRVASQHHHTCSASHPLRPSLGYRMRAIVTRGTAGWSRESDSSCCCVSSIDPGLQRGRRASSHCPSSLFWPARAPDLPDGRSGTIIGQSVAVDVRKRSNHATRRASIEQSSAGQVLRLFDLEPVFGLTAANISCVPWCGSISCSGLLPRSAMPISGQSREGL